MFKTTVAVLREQLRESQRREREYLRMIGNLNDRLANSYGQPWTLPPRPIVPLEEADDETAYLIDL